jgi:hypothetical protein
MAKDSESIVASPTLYFGTHTDTESEADSAVEDYSSPITESSSRVEELLDKDPFGNERSKKLFEAIDELRSCGAGQDIDLPQVRNFVSFHCSKITSLTLTDDSIARDCWQTIGWEVFTSEEFDRHSISGRWESMHKICNSHNISTHCP